MHLDDERIQRLLHGELEPAGERLARQHLATCGDCRGLIDEARGEEHRLFDLLREVDHSVPDRDLSAILAARRSPGTRRQRWAAGILLLTAAAGAAYAAPGSPLPGALDRLVTILARAEPQRGTESTATDTTAPGAGIAVPAGDRLTIRFLVEGDGAVATLSLTDGDEAVVRAVEGAAMFSSDVDRLSVRSQGPARFEVLIPRSAPWIEVLAGGTPVFRKRAAEVVAEGEPGADGSYRLELWRPVR